MDSKSSEFLACFNQTEKHLRDVTDSPKEMDFSSHSRRLPPSLCARNDSRAAVEDDFSYALIDAYEGTRKPWGTHLQLRRCKAGLLGPIASGHGPF